MTQVKTMVFLLTTLVALPLLGDDPDLDGEIVDSHLAYCSATATDGIWAVSWGYGSAAYHCSHIDSYLQNATTAPVLEHRHGYFTQDNNHWVNLRCRNLYRNYYGFSDVPLRQAYRDAQWSYSHCLFDVRG